MPAPCMQACSRGFDGPLEIQKLAREYYPISIRKHPKRNEMKQYPLSAPACGLSAAWQCARMGYEVSVYDAAHDLGRVAAGDSARKAFR